LKSDGPLLRVLLNRQYRQCNEVHTEWLNEAAHIPTALKRRRITNRKKKGTYRVLVGKTEEKETNFKNRRRSEGMDWIELAQDMERWRTLVNAESAHNLQPANS
jgi:hypothetical protein